MTRAAALVPLLAACTVGRYRAYADRASDVSRRAAIAQFEGTHQVVRIRHPEERALPPKHLPFDGRALDRRALVRTELDRDGAPQLVFIGAAGGRARIDHQCGNGFATPLYRFYRARDGHVIVLRLVPDVRTTRVSTLAVMLTPSPFDLYECGDRPPPRGHASKVFLGDGDPDTVELVEAHFDRAVIRED